tara:strand:- start:102 stop:1931 length:1830 start_codon:yes stop_codon:yes gene_type:complete
MADKPTYTKPLSLDQLGYEPEELEDLRKRWKADSRDNTVHINVEGYGKGRLVINNQLGGAVRFYPDEANKAANIRTAENLAFANEIFNAPATLAPFLGAASKKITPKQKQKAGVVTSQVLHRTGNLLRDISQNIVNRYRTAGTQTINVKGTTVTPSTSNVTGTTTKGNLQSKESALQTRISQFQAGTSKSTRDLKLTTEFAKGSVLKEVPYSQVRGKSQIQQQRFRETGQTDIANKLYRIDIALMNGNLYEAKKLAKNIKIDNREIQKLPTASISDKRGYIDMKGGEIVQRYAQKSTSPGNIAPPGGDLLTSKVKEVLNISGFKSVKEIEEAKIQYQKELDMFRKTELGIQTLEDAYTHFGKNRSMSGFKAPSGYEIRQKGKVVNVENQTGLSIASSPLRTLESKKRLFPQQPDESSILPLFQKAVGIDKAPVEAASYIKTSKKIYNEVEKAITRYNKEKGRKLLSKEHIFDVDFHNKLQEIVPNFSGQGSNELGNMSILNLSLNSSTGARAGALKDRTVDPETGAVDYPSVTDALIKNVQEGVGVDYQKSISDFIEYDIGNKVKNLSQQEWDWLLEEIINSQDTGRTVQDILVESMKKLQTIEDVQFN